MPDTRAVVYLAGVLASSFPGLEERLSRRYFKTRKHRNWKELINTTYEPVPSCLLIDPGSLFDESLEIFNYQHKPGNFLPPIVYLASDSSVEQAVRIMRAGALHFLLAGHTDIEEILATIQEGIEKSIEPSRFIHSLRYLTESERTIALLVEQGLISKQIAERLDCSVRTVEWHRRNILRKRVKLTFS